MVWYDGRIIFPGLEMPWQDLEEKNDAWWLVKKELKDVWPTQMA